VIELSLEMKEKDQTVASFLDASLTAVQQVIPLSLSTSEPEQIHKPVKIEFGVLIGITGDFKGKLLLSGNTDVFSSIGESMFGMALEGEMLLSFSGELGNMIAGGISTEATKHGIESNITAPTIMSGSTCLTGFKQANVIKVSIGQLGEIMMSLLID
jgi:chemotaxis protein CheX